jgi:hypothetical protein
LGIVQSQLFEGNRTAEAEVGIGCQRRSDKSHVSFGDGSFNSITEGGKVAIAAGTIG